MGDGKLPLFQDFPARRSLLIGVRYAGNLTRDAKGRLLQFATKTQLEAHSILRADRAFFEAMREEKLAEREAIAVSLEQAGKHEEAALVRARPAPEPWRAP